MAARGAASVNLVPVSRSKRLIKRYSSAGGLVKFARAAMIRQRDNNTKAAQGKGAASNLLPGT